MTKILITLIGLLLLSPALSLAEESKDVLVHSEDEITNPDLTYYMIESKDENIPTLEYGDQGPFRIIFKDGRVANIGEFVHKVDVQLPGRLSEMTCNYDFNQTPCKVNGEILTILYRLYWEKHPDPSKIGNMVKISRVRDSNDPNATEIVPAFISDAVFTR